MRGISKRNQETAEARLYFCVLLQNLSSVAAAAAAVVRMKIYLCICLPSLQLDVRSFTVIIIIANCHFFFLFLCCRNNRHTTSFPFSFIRPNLQQINDALPMIACRGFLNRFDELSFTALHHYLIYPLGSIAHVIIIETIVRLLQKTY